MVTEVFAASQNFRLANSVVFILFFFFDSFLIFYEYFEVRKHARNSGEERSVRKATIGVNYMKAATKNYSKRYSHILKAEMMSALMTSAGNRSQRRETETVLNIICTAVMCFGELKLVHKSTLRGTN